MTYSYDRTAARPGPHWNPWPQVPASLREDLETLHELAQSKALGPDVGRKLGHIWMTLSAALKDEKKAPDFLEKAKRAFSSLPPAQQSLVPRTIIDLIHGL